MPLFELTDSGVVVATEQQVIDRFGARQLAEVDDLLEVHEGSINGQYNAIYAAALLELAEVLVDLAGGIDPDKATGFILRAQCAITGISKRAATYSKVAVNLTLDASKTVPAGAEMSVSGNSDAVFVLDADVTSTTAGVYPGTATAKSAGPVYAPTGKLTVIETTVSGWTAVTNPSDATPGLAQETDEELRTRRAETLVAQGGATVDALLAELLGVSGVTSRNVFDNDTQYTSSDGIPPHAFETVVVGGVDADVAAQVWASKPAGIQAHGVTSVQVTDDQGFAHTIGITRPTLLTLYVWVLVSQAGTSPAPTADAIKQALVNATLDDEDPAYLGLGGDVYSARLLCAALEVEGVINAKINVSFSAIGSFDTNLHSQVLSVLARQQATLDTANITVTGV